MEMHRVTSSNLESIGYDPAARELRIQFRDVDGNPGRTYSYEGVSPAKHAALMAAKSKGGHFAAHIRPFHPATRLDPEKKAA